MRKTPSLSKRLPAGIVDAAFASLATFAIGLAAVNLLADTERGVYAVYFTTFMMATVLPRHLIFTPAQVDAVGLPQELRIPLVRKTLALGIGPAAVGATSVGLAALVAAPLTTSDVIVPLTVTTAAASLLSPLQDHVRNMMHIAARSWLAAAISVVQFTVAVTGLVVMWRIEVPIPWIPFGSLAIANLVSLTFGWGVTMRSHRLPVGENPLQMRDLARRGGWLVLQAAAPATAGFVGAAIITRLASAEALGFAEAARVVAQPILVFATGISSVLAPRTMEAAMRRDLKTAVHASSIFLRAVGLAGIAYLAVAGWSWQLNPMTRIVPSAYEIGGLVALTILANIANASVFLQVNELLGAKRETTLAKLAWVLAPIGLLGAATAGVTGAYARAIGRLGETSTRFAVQRVVIRPQYDVAPDADG